MPTSLRLDSTQLEPQIDHDWDNRATSMIPQPRSKLTLLCTFDAGPHALHHNFEGWNSMKHPADTDRSGLADRSSSAMFHYGTLNLLLSDDHQLTLYTEAKSWHCIQVLHAAPLLITAVLIITYWEASFAINAPTTTCSRPGGSHAAAYAPLLQRGSLGNMNLTATCTRRGRAPTLGLSPPTRGWRPGRSIWVREHSIEYKYKAITFPSRG
jgi:hypothetical protein